MGFFKNLVKSASNAVKGATKVVSLKNVVGVVTGQKSVTQIAAEAGNRAIQGAVTPFIPAPASPTPLSVPTAPVATVIAPSVKRPLSVDGSATVQPTTPAVPIKTAAQKGILGTSVSTGNSTIDGVLGGMIAGGTKSLVQGDDGVKQLVSATTEVAAQSWFEKYWYYIAGGVVALILFIRGKK